MRKFLKLLGEVILYVFILGFTTSVVGITFGIYIGVVRFAEICGVSPDAASTIAWVFLFSGVILIGAVFALRDKESKCEKIAEDAKKQIEDTKKLLEQRMIESWKSEYRAQFEKVIYEQAQTYPWMAQQFADLFYVFDEKIANHLITKKRPAASAAEQVKAIAKEKRELQKQCKMYEYQLNYYETLFPWLEEFKQVDPKEGYGYIDNDDFEKKDEYNSLRKWLSPEEYANLPTSKRYQMALDRYMRRPKSDWEIGIEFERYVGYLYENEGYKVRYNGALMGLQDMGRDLIAQKERVVYIIQCKRWARDKTIHEKHIFQLYGSVVLMSVSENTRNKGVFITTATLSDVAKRCADYLGIEYKEGFPFGEYPLIKCNVAQDGEKIYHLPFDQQYDRVQISGKRGAMYVQTVEEAEKLGFRRAWRWRPERGD